MDSFPLDEFLKSPQLNDFPGSQVYLYRLLRLLASRDSFSFKDSSLTYATARKLARQLEIDTPEQLTSLISDLGIGTLRLKISGDSLRARLSRPQPLPPHVFAGESLCELERGLIDGSLELISGMPVESATTRCCSRGNKECVFEAVRDEATEEGSPRFVPMPLAAAAGAGTGVRGSLQENPMQSASHSWFLDLAARELARARRHERPLTLLYADIDDLRQVNANYGRTTGDRVIKIVAAALSRSCRSEDYLWHLGEDEFALVLTETGAEEGGMVAQRLITEVQSTAESKDIEPGVSVSIGFSTFPAQADNLSDLFARARSALYRAKSLGKGRALAQEEAGVEEAEAEEAEREQPPRPQAKKEPDSVRSVDLKVVAEKRPAAGDEPGREELLETGQHLIATVLAFQKPLLLAGTKQILSASANIKVAQEVEDPSRLAASVSDIRPDLICADLPMVTADDCAVLKLLRDENLPCKVLVLVTEVDQDTVSIAAGKMVDGVLLQEASAKEIVTAMDEVYQGKTVFPDELRSAINELEDSRRLLEELSERELQVLRLVAEGKSNSQIAEELFITVNTVRFHLANIYQKLGVSNRTEATNFYLRQDGAPDTQTRLL